MALNGSDHPPAGLLARFLRGEDAPEEGARLRAHLEAGCVPCLLARSDLARAIHAEGAGALRRGLGIGQAPARSEVERSQLLALASRRLERLAWVEGLEGRVAPGLLGELERLPREERPQAVRHQERYQLLGLAEYLTAQAREAVFHDLARALDLGDLAIEVADCLDSRVYLPRAIADAGALAAAALGNARRVAADLVGAGRAFAAARERLAAGSGDEGARAEVLSLLGSLRRSQARFPEARRVLEEALARARRGGTPEQQARIVLKLAKTLGDGGDPEAAIALLERSTPLLDRPGPGDLSHYRLQSLAGLLVEAGRPAEARAAFNRARRDLLERVTGAADRKRLVWLDGLILWGEKKRVEAEERLRAARDAFRDLDAGYDVALISLDLAAFYLEEGRTADVRRLAEEMLPVFTSRALHRHALHALVLFQRAAEAESLTLAWVRDLARYLRHARENPALRFQPHG